MVFSQSPVTAQKAVSAATSSGKPRAAELLAGKAEQEHRAEPRQALAEGAHRIEHVEDQRDAKRFDGVEEIDA